MEVKTNIGDWRNDFLVVHLKCDLPCERVFFHQIIENKNDVLLHESLLGDISNNWDEVKKKNPKAFAGPTVRLVEFHQRKDGSVVFELLPSDYSQGMFLTFFGVAMVPITSDGYIILQGAKEGIAASIGGGIRVPGCTSPHNNIIDHVIKEMKEEFNVDIGYSQLRVLGLIEAKPPISKRHHELVVKVLLEETLDELKSKWELAKDKWEGELMSLRFSHLDILSILFDSKIRDKYNKQSLLILALILGAEKEDDFYKENNLAYDFRIV